MADRSIIIVGGGIAGLAAGCYGQMNGYRTEVFEMHDKPGGLCTAWQRKGYTIDGCLHWLTDSAPGRGFYRFWEELGMLQGKQVINMEQFHRIEGTDGRVFNMYCDVDRLEQHMRELAPEDARFIGECARAIRRFERLDMPVDKAPELHNPFDGLKAAFRILPFLGDFRKWTGMTMQDFSIRFKNPLLREAWQATLPVEFPSLFMLTILALMDQKAGGYVIGGSMELSRAIERRYLGLGGQLRYKSRVSKVLVENDRAVGIKLTDGSEHRADYVISAADGHATIFEMLEGKYVNDMIRGYYERLPIFQPLIHIGLGVNRSFSDMPQMVSGLLLALEKPVTIAGTERKWLNVCIYNFDPTLAPAGKTLLTVMFESRFAYWESLHKDVALYKAEKEQIAATVIGLLERRFPGLAAQVEMHDVATPVTFHRYTGNWQGSFEGWLPTAQTIRLRMSKTLPGLDGFYMAGQWVQPGGGLPSAVMTGCHVIQMICKRDGKPFAATVP